MVLMNAMAKKADEPHPHYGQAHAHRAPSFHCSFWQSTREPDINGVSTLGNEWHPEADPLG